MRKLMLVFTAIVALSSLSQARVVKVITIDGPIGAITLKHFERALEQAEKEDVKEFLVRLKK